MSLACVRTNRRLKRSLALAVAMIETIDTEIEVWREIKAKAEAFPVSHCVSGLRLITEADEAIGALDDLRGKLQVLE